ncbi:MAG: hypothetical protein JWP85_1159 [Rhodoglobus sp.]|nr:hypothetical protein [Rhodoglobus sp.]
MKRATTLGMSMLIGLSLALGGAVASSAAPTNTNNPDYWETLPGEVCVDVGYETEDSASNPYVLPEAPGGRVYSKVIVKVGSSGHGGVIDENEVFLTGLVAGAEFVHPDKNSISHVIVCTVPRLS